MLPALTPSGCLPPGIHAATWAELCSPFGGAGRRAQLLGGLQHAAINLRDAGARDIWLDGSFVTDKEEPGDYDGVWDPRQTDLSKVDPIFIDFNDLQTGRAKQKAKYRGELFPHLESIDFFQKDRNGDPKGIVLLDLRTIS